MQYPNGFSRCLYQVCKFIRRHCVADNSAGASLRLNLDEDLLGLAQSHNDKLQDAFQAARAEAVKANLSPDAVGGGGGLSRKQKREAAQEAGKAAKAAKTAAERKGDAAAKAKAAKAAAALETASSGSSKFVWAKAGETIKTNAAGKYLKIPMKGDKLLTDWNTKYPRDADGKMTCWQHFNFAGGCSRGDACFMKHSK